MSITTTRPTLDETRRTPAPLAGPEPVTRERRSRRPMVAALVLSAAIVAAGAAGVFVASEAGDPGRVRPVIESGPVNANLREGRVPAAPAQPPVLENANQREGRVPAGLLGPVNANQREGRI